MKTYVIYPQAGDGRKDKWVTETNDEGKVVRRFYSARRSAINGVVIRHPGKKAITMIMDCEENNAR